MIYFEPFTINGTTYQLNELTFQQALDIAMIPSNREQKRLTLFLNYVLNRDDSEILTVEERYYILLKYLVTQGETILGVNATIGDFLLEDTELIKEINFNDKTIRKLTGRDVEFLERQCKNAGEWIVGAVAAQLSYSEHEVMQGVLSPDALDYESQIIARAEYIGNLKLSEHDKVFDDYFTLVYQMEALVRISFTDDGIALRGADDAQSRFRTTATFTGFIAELAKHYP